MAGAYGRRILLSPQLRTRRILGAHPYRVGRPILQGRLASVWWLVLLRGVAAVLFGAFCLMSPRLAAFSLVFLFAAFALCDGGVLLATSARGGGLARRWWMTLAGATSVAAGLFTFTEPRRAALLLIAIMGVWLIVRGLANILGGISTRDELGRDWSLPIDGLMSALFGVGLIAAPRVGALGLVWALGGWAIIHGLLMIPFGLKLRRWRAGAYGDEAA
jgi:uncharacterized membrane protein HdeD (DUF308 family)